jgi:hypothetical protein
MGPQLRMGPISWIVCTFSCSTLWWQLAMNHLKSWAPYLHAPRHHPTPNTVNISYHCLYQHSLLVTTVVVGFKLFYLDSWINISTNYTTAACARGTNYNTLQTLNLCKNCQISKQASVFPIVSSKHASLDKHTN